MKKLFLIIPIALSIFCFAAPQVNAGTIKTPPSTASGLTGWWTFDGRDVVSGKMVDRSGNGALGSFTNIASSTFYTAGKISQAGNFDGTNDYVDFGDTDQSEFTNTQAFTVSAWIYPTKTSGVSNVLGRALTSGKGWYFTHNPDGTSGIVTQGMFFDYYDGVGFIRLRTDNFIVPFNKWSHVMVVKTAGSNSVNNYEIYVDGVNRTAARTSGNPSSIDYSGTTFQVGARQAGAFFGGMIDDVRIYNRALSTTEIGKVYRFGAAKIAESKSPGSLASGLLGHWTFDGGDIVSGTMIDRSGNGNTGRFTGIASSSFYSAGIIGQAGDFDGVNDYVSLSDSSLPSGAASRSVSVWFKTKSSSALQWLVIYGGSTSNTGYYLGLYNGSDCTGTIASTGGNLSVVAGTNGTGSNVCSNINVNDGKWHLLTTVYNGSTHSIYLDGIFQSTRNQTPATTLAGASGLKISYTSSFFNGLIDDVRIYNRALTSQEIIRLYNLGQPNKTAVTTTNKGTLSDGLISHWTFDGKDIWGGVLRNKGSSGLVGNFNNIASSTFYQPGVIGQGATYDGTNDFVSTAAHTQLDGASQFSVSGWANMRTATSRGTIFGRWSSATNWLQAFQFWVGGQFYLTVGNAGTTYGILTNNVGGVPPRTQWNHYVVVFDGTQTGNANRLRAFINGVEYAMTYSGTIPATAPTVVGSDHVGYDRHNSISLDGSLDDVRIYNRPLSLTEIKQLYNMGR